MFLQRLRDIQQFPDNVIVCNASVEEVETARARPGMTIIARLDGTDYYDFTGRNLYHFLEQRKHRLLPYCGWLRNMRHSSQWTTRLINRYLSRCAVWMLRNAHGLVFQSEMSRKMYEMFLGYRAGRVPERIILNGVSLDEFDPRDRVATPLGGFPAVVISASVFRPHKRLHDAVRLVNRLSKDYGDIRLHVFGRLDAPTEAEVRRQDLSRCVFHGQMSPAQLPARYRGGDVMLSLCIFDACPNVVCEGLASGLPVITLQESGASELVGPDNGDWVVEEGLPFGYYELQTPEALPRLPGTDYAERISRVIEDLPTHKERARQRAVDALDIRKVARRYCEFVAEIDGR